MVAALVPYLASGARTVLQICDEARRPVIGPALLCPMPSPGQPFPLPLLLPLPLLPPCPDSARTTITHQPRMSRAVSQTCDVDAVADVDADAAPRPWLQQLQPPLCSGQRASCAAASPARPARPVLSYRFGMLLAARLATAMLLLLLALPGFALL